MNSQGNNNINIASSQEIGIECDINDNNTNLNDQNNMTNNNIQINNQSQINPNNFQYQNNEEEYEEDEEEEIDDGQNQSNLNKNNLIPMENFSQQVDFLSHPDNPEYLPPKMKKKTKILKKSNSVKPNSKKKLKKNKSKSKNKNKNKKNKIIQKLRPEFDCSTKLAPVPRTQSIFYGPSLDETKCEKQLRERAQKIAEYEENFWRQKEIYKAKRKREEEELKNRYNYIKSRTSNNFYPKHDEQSEKSKNDFIKEFDKLKIEYPQTDIRNYECNPQKYDNIIHSLLKEISEIKIQRKKENEHFVNQIKKLQGDLDDKNAKKNKNKKRPKSGNKVILKKNKQNNNNIFNIIKNYYKPYKSRPKTGKKNNSIQNNQTIENEIPVEPNNSSKNTTTNNYYQKEKEKILKNIQNLENQKNDKINEIIEQTNKINNSSNNINIYNSNRPIPNQLYYSQISNNGNINNNLNQNINYNINNGFPYPAQINIMNNVNIRALNYQEKIQILSELNNNISKFTSGIPKLVNKVNQTLDKIYGNTDNPIKKAINNHPFVLMASKSAYQMIEKNSDILIEAMIDDLLFDCVDDLQNIEETQKRIKKRNDFYMFMYQAKNNLEAIKEKEKRILDNYNFK